ncbi:MAG: regulatory protein RecX [Actinomycetota bacterium]
MHATSPGGRGSRVVKDPKSCHERALGLLAVRPRARRELERRLRAAGFEAEEVDEVLIRLERVGLVDDEAFARQMADHQFGSRRAGRRAVASALLAKGIAPDLAARVADDAPDAEHDRALELARSRAGRLAGVEQAKAFGRLTSLLVRRGYSPEVARSAARKALEVDDQD